MFNQKEYNKNYYAAYKDEIRKRVKDSFEKRRQLFRKLKSKPCSDCGFSYPYWVMQFDHVRGVKLFNIGENLYSIGTKKLLEEIEKCDVVCSNCHAERTHQRLTGIL